MRLAQIRELLLLLQAGLLGRNLVADLLALFNAELLVLELVLKVSNLLLAVHSVLLLIGQLASALLANRFLAARHTPGISRLSWSLPCSELIELVARLLFEVHVDVDLLRLLRGRSLDQTDLAIALFEASLVGDLLQAL